MKQRVEARPQGTRRVNRKPAHPVESNGMIRRWMTRLCGALVLLVVSASLVKGGMSLTARPVAEVKIEGEFNHLQKAHIAEQIYSSIQSSFMRLDLRDMQQALEQDPWVERADVSRRWPDTLVVRITEQQPIARWGKDAFLNQRGQIIRPHEVVDLSYLPLLAGPDSYAGELMEGYQSLSKLLRQQQLRIQQVIVDESLAWKVVLNNDLQIVLGRDLVMEKIERFLTVYKAQLKNRLQDVAVIDIRYSNGLAVSWKPSAAEKVTKNIKSTAGIAG